MTLPDIIATITANPAGSIALTATVFAVADFITGAGAAFRRHEFRLERLNDWVAVHLLGRVMPIAGLAVLGDLFVTDALLVVAGLALATYLAETAASIRASLALPTEV